MGVMEIISGILLLIVCIVIIVVTTMQESKQNGAQALGGGSSDSYLGKNSGRTLDAMLIKVTKYAAIVFMVLTLLAGVAAVFLGK